MAKFVVNSLLERKYRAHFSIDKYKLQYTSAAAERYKLQLERDLAKSKQAEAEEAAQASKPAAPVPTEPEAEPQTSSSTPAPAEKLLSNGKAPSVGNVSDTGSVTSNGANSATAAPASAGGGFLFTLWNRFQVVQNLPTRLEKCSIVHLHDILLCRIDQFCIDSQRISLTDKLAGSQCRVSHLQSNQLLKAACCNALRQCILNRCLWSQ